MTGPHSPAMAQPRGCRARTPCAKSVAAMRRPATAFLLALLLLPAPAAAAELKPLEIASRTGVHVFAVGIAATAAAREEGLMFRRSLPEGQGMLFDFHREQEGAFWMKNTYSPLDMIFLL